MVGRVPGSGRAPPKMEPIPSTVAPVGQYGRPPQTVYIGKGATVVYPGLPLANEREASIRYHFFGCAVCVRGVV